MPRAASHLRFSFPPSRSSAQALVPFLPASARSYYPKTKHDFRRLAKYRPALATGESLSKPKNDIFDQNEVLLAKVINSQPSTSSRPPAINADALAIFLLLWRQTSLSSESNKRLAAIVQDVHGLQPSWMLATMKRLRLLHSPTAETPCNPDWQSYVDREVALLVAIQSDVVSEIHLALWRLIDTYATHSDTRHIAFSLLETLRVFAIPFIQYIALPQRIELEKLIRYVLKKPSAPLSRHQLWQFMLSEASAILLLRPLQDIQFDSRSISSDQKALGRSRADALTRSVLQDVLGNLTPPQHLHWIQKSSSRPRFRVLLVNTFMQRRDGMAQLQPIQMARLADCVAQTALALLNQGESPRAMDLLQSWDGIKTESFWSALIRVAAVVDQSPLSPSSTTTTTTRPIGASSSQSPTSALTEPVPPQSNHFQHALRDLPVGQLTPSIFVTLLVAARNNVEWLSALIKLAQSPPLSQSRRVQEALIESVIFCFEQQRSAGADFLPDFGTENLRLSHRQTRVAALQGKIQQVVDYAVEAALKASGVVRTGKAAEQRDVRLASILVRAISASLAQHRVDLALDVLLSPHIPPVLLSTRLVQRVAQAVITKETWQGPSGVERLIVLFRRCDTNTLAQVVRRPQLVFELVRICFISSTEDAQHGSRKATRLACDRFWALIQSTRGLVKKSQLEYMVKACINASPEVKERVVGDLKTFACTTEAQQDIA